MSFVRSIACTALVVAFVASASVARAQKSPTAQAALDRAYKDLAENGFAAAAGEMETAVRYEPRFAYGWYLLASSSRRAGDPDRAAAAYRRYAELRPTEPDPYFGLGLSLEAVGDREGAVAALRRYVELDQRTTSGEFTAEARTRIAALEHAGKPAAVSPERDKEAAALLAARKFTEAALFLRESLKTAPADAGAWYKLGFALRQANQPIDAAKAYQRSLTLKPADIDAYYGLGQVLVASNRPDEALVAFRTYVKAGVEKADPRWISKARKEIARLEEAVRAPHGAAAGAAVTPPAAAMSPPATSPAPIAEPQPAADHMTSPPAHAVASAPATEPPHTDAKPGP